MMNKPLTMSRNSLKRVQIIYNDDVQIIDFLSDLMDREPIHELQRYVDFANRQPICLLHSCKMDEIVVLVAYKAPFGLNTPDNRLTLYAYNDLRGLCGYFNRWLDITDEKTNKAMHTALKEITSLLYLQWAEDRDENDTQLDFMG